MIKITSNMPMDRTFVNWQLSRYCNKKCHYCTSFDYAIRGKDVEVLYTDEEIRLHDNIASMLPKMIKHGNLQFYGGEPTLHPKGIEYFNNFCKETKDNDKVTVFLVTHGDIDEEKIRTVNPHGKREHIISISYHHYQVKFDNWFERVKVWHENTNAIVAAIIPRNEKVWDAFELNVRTLMDYGIPLDIKSELDQVTLESDMNGIKRFKDLYYESGQNRSDFYTKHFIDTMYFREGERVVEVNDIEVLNGIPIVAGRTICKNKQYGITEDEFGFACGEGHKMKLTEHTTIDDVQRFMDKHSTMTCERTHCCENRHLSNEITVIGGSLDDPKYKEFFNNIL